MTALSAYRATVRMGDQVSPDLLNVPVKGSTTIHYGSLVCLDKANGGYAIPGKTGLSLLAIGRSEAQEGPTSGTGGNNSSGADGAIRIEVRQGVFKWANSASADAITAINVGDPCFVVDDQTVALTDGDGTRSVAGVIVQVDTDGVWVKTELGIGMGAGGGAAGEDFSELNFSIPLANIASGDVVNKFIPGFTGRIISFQAVVKTAATTSGKAATLVPQINVSGGSDVPVTGGSLALTSANMTPVGHVVAASAITGANTFGASDGISLLASSVTAFIEGEAELILTVQATA